MRMDPQIAAEMQSSVSGGMSFEEAYAQSFRGRHNGGGKAPYNFEPKETRPLTGLQQKVHDALTDGPMLTPDIGRKVGVMGSRTSNALLRLESLGMVGFVRNGRFKTWYRSEQEAPAIGQKPTGTRREGHYKRAKAVSEVLKNMGIASIGDIAHYTEEHPDTVRRCLYAMIDDGQVVRKGEASKTRYALAPEVTK